MAPSSPSTSCSSRSRPKPVPRCVSFIRDATEQRAAQEALRAERPAAALHRREHSATTPSICSTATATSLTWNPGARAHQGLRTPTRFSGCTSRASSRRKTSSAATPPNCCARPPHAAAWKKKAGACAKTARASGPTSCSPPSATSTGAVTGFAKITRDLTDRKQAQESVIAELSSAAAGQCRHSQAAGRILRQHPADGSARRRHAGALRRGDRQAACPVSRTPDDAASKPTAKCCSIPNASPAGQAFRTRRPVILNKIDRWPFAPRIRQASHSVSACSRASGFRSFIASGRLAR